ncbi:MAG: PHP-associated domain-containing protein, partial [Actinomycetota bacterium]
DWSNEEAFATTKGIRSSGRSNSCHASVSVMADDAGETQTGWAYAIGTNPVMFDPMRRNITEDSLVSLTAAGLVDAIEAHNSKTSLASLNRRAVEFGEAHGLALGSGSDAHVPDALGSAFVEMPDFDGPVDFLARLREGRVVGHHWDKPRPWSPRIVPSVSDQG